MHLVARRQTLVGCVLRAGFQHGAAAAAVAAWCITASSPCRATLRPLQAYDVHWLAATVAGGAGVEALGEGIAAVEQAGELEAASADYAPEVRSACCACSSGAGLHAGRCAVLLALVSRVCRVVPKHMSLLRRQGTVGLQA